jgi:hypothetical protein
MQICGGNSIQQDFKRKDSGPLGLDYDPTVLFYDVNSLVEIQMRSLHKCRRDADRRAIPPFFDQDFHVNAPRNSLASNFDALNCEV